MKYYKGNSITEVYSLLIKDLLNQPIIGNTKEINNCCLEINNPSLTNIKFPPKKTSLKYANAELEWYWSGDNSCETIGKNAKMWLAISDDGKTNNSAYGYILFKKYGFNQLEQIIKVLKKDMNSRRAVLNISDPTINRITTKDMQCTIALQFLIRDGGLQETVYMRSNDVNFGLPYDYVFFMTIGKYIANQLGLILTKYTHHATSMHMYLRDEEKFKQIDSSEYFSIDWEKYVKEFYEKI